MCELLSRVYIGRGEAGSKSIHILIATVHCQICFPKPLYQFTLVWELLFLHLLPNIYAFRHSHICCSDTCKIASHITLHFFAYQWGWFSLQVWWVSFINCLFILFIELFVSNWLLRTICILWTLVFFVSLLASPYFLLSSDLQLITPYFLKILALIYLPLFSVLGLS